jgi:hypothetical protein
MAFPGRKLHDQAFTRKQDALDILHSLTSLNFCNPAFTEASFVSCHSDAFFTTVRRLSNEDASFQCRRYGDSGRKTMDFDAGSAALERTASHHSNASGKSSRSHTVRIKPRKYASYMSSSASSISDKSLTSFPSFSPESPRDERPLAPKAHRWHGKQFTKALGSCNLDGGELDHLVSFAEPCGPI